MTAGRQRSREERPQRGDGRRHGRWPRTAARMSLPGRRQLALDRIEQTLMTADPELALRFAVFTRLTQDEAMPGTEQARGPRQRFLRPAVMLPVLAAGLMTLLAAGWLLGGSQPCPPPPRPAAHTVSPANPAARCQPSPSLR